MLRSVWTLNNSKLLHALLCPDMATGISRRGKDMPPMHLKPLTSTAAQTYPHKQNFCGVFLFSIQKEGVQGGLAVLGSPPLSQAVLDPQRVTHV